MLPTLGRCHGVTSCRYEREINRAERSALKMIVERDNVPGHFLVLCVSDVAQAAEAGKNAAEGKKEDA